MGWAFHCPKEVALHCAHNCICVILGKGETIEYTHMFVTTVNMHWRSQCKSNTLTHMRKRSESNLAKAKMYSLRGEMKEKDNP